MAKRVKAYQSTPKGKEWQKRKERQKRMRNLAAHGFSAEESAAHIVNRAMMLADARSVSFRARRMYATARGRATRDGLVFTLMPSHIQALMVDTCPVLGLTLTYGDNPPRASSATLDKIIPALGYVPGNIAIISQRANRLKSDATIEELDAINRYVHERAAAA